MGKTRPPERNKLSKRKRSAMNGTKQTASPERLLEDAVALLQTSEPEAALQLATKALKVLRSRPDQAQQLSALGLLGEISVELGDIAAARAYFIEAVELDADGEAADDRGGGPEKFLWLAQLSEQGGVDSVKWYQKGADVLRKQIALLVAQEGEADVEGLLEEKRVKLANALCGIAEVYMTDLSWDDNLAEEQCNAVMEEALSVASDRPETLQTVASVRISQSRQDEARQYLLKSLDLWKDLDPENPHVPDFPTRISLSRLLMEAELENEAIEVLERLVAEDDQSIEAWYLGGWCLHLLAEKQIPLKNQGDNDAKEATGLLLQRSRSWLQQCLDLYALLEYEDERLQEHASELVQNLNQVLGESESTDEEGEADDGAWEEFEGSEDEEMEGT